VRRHEFDVWSFVPGALLAAFGLAVLLAGVDVTEWSWSWVWPVPFVLAGVLLLLSARRREPAAAPSPPPPPPDDSTEGLPRSDGRA